MGDWKREREGEGEREKGRGRGRGSDWEKIIAKRVADNELVSRVYEEFLLLNNFKTIQLQNGQRFELTLHKWPISTWKPAQYH